MRHSARKVPLTVDGRAASSTDPRSWSTYREAARSTAGAGLGFVLDGDGIVCLDLDHVVRPDGSLVGWAAELLAGLPPTYIEVSPSGTGLHVFGFGRLPGRGRRWARGEGTGLEVYADGRFVTVTGARWADSPARLSDLSTVIAALGC
ncbi:bifunctional DNA primase/polymerase [Streptomyces europaeiscabiei]|uniref:bifunctional DNA primase/polymerase n=1 Tax=Streptomyces europaeiscabiei TaxID=146819 RepID=UPI0029C03CB9|nr:bifunctional DNA primase/polymerase [Streptomyces europaeiscabiei]